MRISTSRAKLMTSEVISESQQNNIPVVKDTPNDAYTLLLPNTEFEEKVKKIHTNFIDFNFIIAIFIFCFCSIV
jgi:hypothetical protein